jgi:hypothetical protein
LDSDLAEIYGYTTKAFNQQVKNNIEKFDEEDLMFQLTKEEVKELSRSKFSTLNNDFLRSKFLTSKLENPNLKSKISTSSWGGNRKIPTAFTERGLYMLATILKSKRATQTTLAIIETFVQLRELARNMQAVAATEDEAEKKTLLQKSGELINNVIGSQFETVGTETEVELNFAMVKIRHKVIRGNKKDE